VASALLLIAYVVGALPPTVVDLIGRGWPIVLVLIGLNALIGRRVRFSNFIILGMCVLLMAGVIVVAYGKQASKPRTDYRAPFALAIPAEVRSIKIDVTTLLAPIEINVASGKSVTGEFLGSVESQLDSNFVVNEGVGTVKITEARVSTLPKLDAIGRGKLTLTIPADVTIDELLIRGGEGDLTLTTTNANVKNINVRVQKGNITLALPALPATAALGGTLKTDSGEIALTVPANMTLNLNIQGGNPVYDKSKYLLTAEGTLISTGVREFQVALSLGATGTISIKP
jgi:hypothetical protein